ncbi:hypothetical protein [Roseivirga sp. UBA1976]|uniref:hypothetical protein n=1 Tax=Roseivirga sp. UBA1976 TaxID=1947386 RepID=UPI00257ADDAA|nr:hypothetical protein [Roseivirga sp. UBA1976]MEC7754266.1 hypothetical protein [Bacteroidota bacterium]|tara:strand:+ start:424 stop:717 length:294 start_codon:yes stop_codon:yes gene_type:complete
MSNHPIDQKLAVLEKRVNELIKAYQSERAKNTQLEQVNQQLKAEVNGLEAKLADFQNQYKIAKIVSSTTVEKDEAVELKNKLNEYIKEIDRCIAHLS